MILMSYVLPFQPHSFEFLGFVMYIVGLFLVCEDQGRIVCLPSEGLKVAGVTDLSTLGIRVALGW